MAKRKTDFHPLKAINPFSREYFSKMVFRDWADRENLMKWRRDTAKKFITDIKYLDLLDIDELITQWDVPAEERKADPFTCNMVFKELAIILRMIDSEHQDALYNEENKLHLPGVVKSKWTGKYIYVHYDLEATDANKATKVRSFDTEEEAYWEYMNNRNTMLEEAVTKANMAHLIDHNVYEKYFNGENRVDVRPYEYYKKSEE